ncbi:SDR family oxidoreductase [Jeotgalibacillus proteolyticus]|uniref:NAD-dependent dehydratase n=1 Tax=Jeotgalibacillus proteolyticus TaxID=2082395 RepID=A0A2S5GDU3_9BACL|nr:SDR family oxidoreductase [Jeotgalibacillus proteolyticus]PPA71180.1 NAD-dependent dehydratase [Jeotgalibacillus proteolyticus]
MKKLRERKTVLVIGANGTTGQKVINILAQDSRYYAKGMVRKEEQKETIEIMGGTPVLGDLEEDFSHAFLDVDIVIFAAGAGGDTGPEKTILIDEDGAIKSIDLAKEHGVEKFIMLSAIGADNPSELDLDESMEVYYEAKRRADVHLKNSGLTYTIVRPGLLTNDEPTGKIRASQRLQDRDGEITRADVAEVLVQAIELDNLNNKAFEILNEVTEIKTSLIRL